LSTGDTPYLEDEYGGAADRLTFLCDGRVDVGEDMSEDAGQDNGTLRVTIREAAARLGVTEAAIRKRIQRGSLDKEMGSLEPSATLPEGPALCAVGHLVRCDTYFPPGQEYAAAVTWERRKKNLA
jgi:hypothetical protein